MISINQNEFWRKYDILMSESEVLLIPLKYLRWVFSQKSLTIFEKCSTVEFWEKHNYTSASDFACQKINRSPARPHCIGFNASNVALEEY